MIPNILVVLVIHQEMSKQKLFTIHVTESVHEKLRKIGEKDQSYNSIIDNLVSAKLGSRVK